MNAVKLFFEGYHHNESEKLQVTTAKESQNVTPFPLRKSQETRSVLRGEFGRRKAQLRRTRPAAFCRGTVQRP